MNYFEHWLAMGGYSVYIWSAYGLTSIILLLNLLALQWEWRKTRKTLQLWFKRQ